VLGFKRLLEEENADVRRHGYGNFFTMTGDLRAILDGLLLGDGHYTKANSAGLANSLSVSQCESRVSWLEWIMERLLENGIESSITESFMKESTLKSGWVVKPGRNFLLRTITYRTLKAERGRWYPYGKKIVPKDVDIGNPVVLAQWYMGDGCVNVRKKNVQIATNCFGEDEVAWLSDQLMSRVGVRSSISHSESKAYSKKYPVLHMNGVNAERFLRIVRPHILPCFEYKVPILWEPPNCVKCGQTIENRIGNAKYCDGCCAEKRSVCTSRGTAEILR
jgi:hypothetical protein